VLGPEPLAVRLSERVGSDSVAARYSSPAFAVASRLVQAAAAAPSMRAAATVVAADPRAALEAARLITRLPTVEVQLTSRPEGRAIRSVLDRRRLGVPTGRLARAVLAVPPTEDDYLRGRHRQAMRTNVRHAHEHGITYRSVDRFDERFALARAVVGNRTSDEVATVSWLHRILRSGEFLVTEAADGAPLVFVSLAVDVRCAYLRAFMTVRGREEATLARYALNLYAVSHLGKAGVTHLLGDCAFKVPPGIQHFQHLSGFTAANVKVRPFVA
jgi:hypothetical protein